MPRNYLRLSVAHICPGLLNTDSGNILAFKNRCEWRNIDVEVEAIEDGTRLNPRKYDFYFIGSGPESHYKLASEELYSHRENLYKACQKDALILGVGAGYFLLGNYYQPIEGEILAGIGIFDIRTLEAEKRFTGNTLAKAGFLSPKTVVGFENNNCLTYLGDDAEPFMQISRGKGNNGEDKTEGARLNNTFGTYFHGPILPKNPQLCDYFITLTLNRKYEDDFELASLDDDIEKHAHRDGVLTKY